MAQNNVEKFLVCEPDDRFKLLKDPQVRADVEKHIGTQALAEFLKQAPDLEHMGAGPKNMVFAPGIMGSTLHSEGLGGVWWVDMMRARAKLNELKLNDAGDGDQDEDAEVVAGACDLSYEPFRRAVAKSGTFGGSVQFPYDWRKSLKYSAEAMRDVILKAYDDYGQKVHLVGHSMGGLMIRTTLMLHGKELWPMIGKIVFIGTPHYGSPSIAGYVKNHLWGFETLAVVGMYLSREVFRSMRGALSLLPAPRGVYPGTRNGEEHPCANFDMYKASDWKLDDMDAAGIVKLQAALDEVAEHHKKLYEWHDSLLQEYKDKMLMIAGVGQEGLFRLEFTTKFWGAWDSTNKITDRESCDVNYDGDGRVPLASALLEDVTTRYVKGEHGGLPNIPAVAQDVLAWIKGDALQLPTTCEGALGGHLGGGEDPTPEAPVLSGGGTDSANRFQSLPQYEKPTEDFRKEIEKKIDSGQMTQINLVKLL